MQSKQERKRIGHRLLVGMVSLALLALLVTSCEDAGSGGNPQLVLEQGGVPIPNGGSFVFDEVAKQHNGGPVDRAFTIRNVGDAALSLSGATPVQRIAGDEEFSVLTPPTLEAIDPGSTRDFVLRLSYISFEGERSATISVSTDDPDAGTFSFTVTGTVAFS